MQKNNELSVAYKEKARDYARQKKQYEALKGQLMASHVAVAAGDQAELAVQSARGKRLVNRMPGVKAGTGAYNHPDGAAYQPGARGLHNRQGSGSSGSSGMQRGGIGIGPAPPYALYVQARGLGGRRQTGRESMPVYTRVAACLTMLQNLHPSAPHIKVVSQSSAGHVMLLRSMQPSGHLTRLPLWWSASP